jgi:hypothetical protein
LCLDQCDHSSIGRFPLWIAHESEKPEGSEGIEFLVSGSKIESGHP